MKSKTFWIIILLIPIVLFAGCDEPPLDYNRPIFIEGSIEAVGYNVPIKIALNPGFTGTYNKAGYGSEGTWQIIESAAAVQKIIFTDSSNGGKLTITLYNNKEASVSYSGWQAFGNWYQ